MRGSAPKSKQFHHLNRLLMLSMLAIMAGCAAHEYDRPVYVERERVVQRPVRRQVVVEQPAEVEVAQPVEPVTEVVYEPAPPEVVVVYERDLGPHGRWVQTRYGRCWVWEHRQPGWRPYTVGHWESTDEGWLWVAEGEEVAWGSTCYHYGRWYEDDTYGWVWVPGRVWAPSWCAWREGSGYTAWAPLPPECGDGHYISPAVVDRYVPPQHFVAVETRNITDVHIEKNITVNNTTIINKTVNVTNITYVNNRAVNRGVPVARVEKAVGHKIQKVQVSNVTSVEEANRLRASGHAVRYTPPVIQQLHETHPIIKQPAHKTVEHKPAVAQPKVTEGTPHAGVEHKNHITDHKGVTIQPNVTEPKPHVDAEHKTRVPEHKDATVEHRNIPNEPKAHVDAENKTRQPEHKDATVEHKNIPNEPKAHVDTEHKTRVPEHKDATAEHKNVPAKTPVDHKAIESKEPKHEVPNEPKKQVPDKTPANTEQKATPAKEPKHVTDEKSKTAGDNKGQVQPKVDPKDPKKKPPQQQDPNKPSQ